MSAKARIASERSFRAVAVGPEADEAESRADAACASTGTHCKAARKPRVARARSVVDPVKILRSRAAAPVKARRGTFFGQWCFGCRAGGAEGRCRVECGATHPVRLFLTHESWWSHWPVILSDLESAARYSCSRGPQLHDRLGVLEPGTGRERPPSGATAVSLSSREPTVPCADGEACFRECGRAACLRERCGVA